MALAPNLRRVLQAGVLTLLLATPAAAQMPNINLMQETPTKSAEEMERDAARDKAYRESLRKIPNAQKSNDPWGDVRGSEAAAPKAAPAKPKAAQSAQPKRAKADIPAN